MCSFILFPLDRSCQLKLVSNTHFSFPSLRFLIEYFALIYILLDRCTPEYVYFILFQHHLTAVNFFQLCKGEGEVESNSGSHWIIRGGLSQSKFISTEKTQFTSDFLQKGGGAGVWKKILLF